MCFCWVYSYFYIVLNITIEKVLSSEGFFFCKISSYSVHLTHSILHKSILERKCWNFKIKKKREKMKGKKQNKKKIVDWKRKWNGFWLFIKRYYREKLLLCMFAYFFACLAHSYFNYACSLSINFCLNDTDWLRLLPSVNCIRRQWASKYFSSHFLSCQKEKHETASEKKKIFSYFFTAQSKTFTSMHVTQIEMNLCALWLLPSNFLKYEKKTKKNVVFF